jgi:hypothetical protein
MNYEGVIGEIDLIGRLVELGREQFTGAIRFENDGVIKIVYFKGGDVLSASTNDRTDSIDEILLRAGKVTREHVKQALAKRKENETLGDALLGLGFITRKELTWARRVQVIGILRGVIGWPDGAYAIVPDYLPKREEGTIFPLQQLLVELIVTDADRAKYEQAMESGGAVFAKTAGFDDGFRRLGLNEDAEQIAAQIDGERTASEVAGASGKDIFNVYKLLEALRVLGLVEKGAGIASRSPYDDFAAVGAADATDAWTLEDEPPATTAVMEPPAAAPSMPSWDPTPVASVATPAARSVWDEPDEPIGIAPPDETVELALDPEPARDRQWGFDEAQIETARRASVPLRSNDEVPIAQLPPEPPPARATRRSSPALLWVLLLLVLGAGGWYGWTWWQGRAAHNVASSAPPPPVQRAALRTTPEPIANVPPSVPTQTTTSATATAPAAQTTTTAASTMKPLPTVQRKAPTPVPAPAPTSTMPRIERTATGSPTITNVPAAGAPRTAASSSLDQKYAAMARDFAAQKGGNYTVQFELVCETASVTKALREGGNSIWFVPTTYRGRSCYRVFWGRYDTRDAALAGSKSIPKSLGGSVPVVVRVP